MLSHGVWVRGQSHTFPLRSSGALTDLLVERMLPGRQLAKGNVRVNSSVILDHASLVLHSLQHALMYIILFHPFLKVIFKILIVSLTAYDKISSFQNNGIPSTWSPVGRQGLYLRRQTLRWHKPNKKQKSTEATRISVTNSVTELGRNPTLFSL